MRQADVPTNFNPICPDKKDLQFYGKKSACVRQLLSSLIFAESVVFSPQVLQAIPLVIIVAFHLAPKIATMTPTRAIVPLLGKVLGGTTNAIIQTSTVCTSMVRWIVKE